MTTLREEFENLDVHWKSLKIISQEYEGKYCDGWDVPTHSKYISTSDPLLDLEFDGGYGFPNMPRIIAEDRNFFYFPCKYDGRTTLEKLNKNLSTYLNAENTIYPGG